MLAWEVGAEELQTPAKRPRHLEERRRSSSGLVPHAHHEALARRAECLQQRVQQLAEQLALVERAQRRRAQLAGQLAQHRTGALGRMQAASTRRYKRLQAKRRKINQHLDHVEQVRAQALERDAQTRETLAQAHEARMELTAARREQLLQAYPRMAPQHGRLTVAAATIQAWWRWCRIRTALERFHRTALAQLPLDAAGHMDETFESLTAHLSERSTLALVHQLFRRLSPVLLAAGAASTAHPHRVFLSAYMTNCFPETVLSAPDGQREQALRTAARDMLAAFGQWCAFSFATPLKRSLREFMGGRFKAFALAWSQYTHAFVAWQRADHQDLVDGLAQHYNELVALRLSVGDSPEARSEWWPQIDRQQAAICKRLASLGERDLARQLEQRQRQQCGDVAAAAASASKKRKRTISGESLASSESSPDSGTPASTRPSSPDSEASHSPSPVASAAAARRLEGLVNAQLAHEIALDDNFQLPEPPADLLPDERQALDHLRAELEQTGSLVPLVSALGLVRDSLLEATLPRHQALRTQISSRLDTELLAQQAQHGALDLQALQTYLMDTVSRLCAPHRDEMVMRLRALQDPVVFVGSLLVLVRLMKADLVNFQIASIRPHLRQYAIEYETTKFAACVENGDITLTTTMQWLAQAARGMAEADLPDRLAVLDAAFVMLVSGDAGDLETPETWQMDIGRVAAHAHELNAALLVTCCHSLVVGTHSCLHAQRSFSKDLTEAVRTLVADVADPFEHIEYVALHIQGLVRSAYKALHRPPPPEALEQRLHEALLKLAAPDHPVRGLLRRRALDIVRRALKAVRNEPVPPPSRIHGLEVVSDWLYRLAERMGTLYNHNRLVYAQHYDNIMSGLAPAPQ